MSFFCSNVVFSGRTLGLELGGIYALYHWEVQERTTELGRERKLYGRSLLSLGMKYVAYIIERCKNMKLSSTHILSVLVNIPPPPPPPWLSQGRQRSSQII